MSRAICLTITILGSWALVGCENLASISEPESRPAASVFALHDVQGSVQTSFSATDTVVFVYLLSNPRSTQREYYCGHGGPPVQFLVRHDTTTVEDSYAGVAFPAVVIRGTLSSGEKLEVRWTLSLSSSSLAPGTYSAVANPHLSLDGMETLPELASFFTVR